MSILLLPKLCSRLDSAARAAAMNDFDVPELKRTPLDELCLQVCELSFLGWKMHSVSPQVQGPGQRET
jgi:HrpA-like RNA helicase